MAKGFKAGAGGGAALNFKVVGNPQPEAPSENTIWVNTDVPIGAWYFNATQPENLNEGDVWFLTSTSSPAEFNALKKNGIQVYPMSAKQYVGGALVDVEAKSYQGGEWVDWVTYLYNKGDECTDITGGWKGVNKQSGSTADGTFTKESEYITIKNAYNGTYGATTVNAVDMSLFYTLYMVVSASASSDIEVSIADNFPTASVDSSALWNIGTDKTTVAFPIDTVIGSKRVHIRGKSVTSNLYIHEVYTG